MRIIHKMILGFLMVVSLIWVVGYIAVNASQKALQNSLVDSSISLATEILDKIDRDIYSKIEIFQDYSKALILREAVLESNQEFEKLDNIQTYINKKDKEWTPASLKREVTPFMQGLINNRLSRQLREKIEFYKGKYGYEVFCEVIVTNRYGANVAQTGITTDYRQDDEEWWQEARKDGLYVRDVKYDESADVHSINIGIRIDDEDGDFIGVMKVILNVEEVNNIINELKPGGMHMKHKTMYFKLTTKDGRLIYSTRDFKLFEDVSPLLSLFEGSKGGHVPYAIREGYGSDEERELSVHVHSRGYRDFKGLGWIFMVEHETEEIFAPVAELRNRILTISLAITIFAVLMGIIISRYISNPIKKLRDAAIEIGKGNLNTRIEIGSKDEIGQLSVSFKEMTESLKKTTVELTMTNDQLRHEITERKEAEKERERLLRKTEKINQELKDFAYVVSHDLKAPLRAISQLSQWIAEDYAERLDDTGQEKLNLLLKRARHMHNMIDGILQYSRIGRIGGEPAIIDTRKAVEQVIESLSPPENIRFSVKESLPHITIDPVQINQVFQNLIGNAVKFMDKPEGIIEVGCRDLDAFWEFYVKDNGSGIEGRHFERVFQIFQTIRPRDETDTTGIGLTIVKKIVEHNGGEVSVESEVGKGSIFRFTIPKTNISHKDSKGAKEK